MLRTQWGPWAIRLDAPAEWAPRLARYGFAGGDDTEALRSGLELAGESTPASGACLRIRIDPGDLSADTDVARRAMGSRGADGRLHFSTPFVQGTVDARAASAHFVVPQAGPIPLDLDRRLYSALRLAFVGWAHEQGALCWHGCAVAVRRSGEEAMALALVGPSGSGKTTFATRHAHLGVMADDLVVVTGPDGADLALAERAFVWRHPFSGREGIQWNGPRVAPLGWFGSLTPCARTSVESVEGASAVPLALRSAFAVCEDAAPALLRRANRVRSLARAIEVDWLLADSPLPHLPTPLRSGAVPPHTEERS